MRYLKGKYLIACSGGPDSMALLDMCYQKGLMIYVCHINYHKRDSAERDEKIIYDYCQKRKIKLEVFHFNHKEKGNFQDIARRYRYNCFKEMIHKYQLKAVLVGHHYDDLLETYLLQKKHGGKYNYYGLARKVKIMNIEVIRPLLKKRKEDLIDYCHKNNIDYGIDESNDSDLYQRNIIRKELNNYDQRKKDKLYKEIIKENEKKKKIDEITISFINKREHFLKKELLYFKYRDNVLRMLIKQNLSAKYLDDIFKKIKNDKNMRILIDDIYLISEYDYIEIFKKEDIIFEEYIIDDLRYFKTKHFKLAKKGSSFEGVSVKKEDFPLTIRSFKKGDKIKMLYGDKKINRFFIDQKISYKDRLTWPIVLNKDNEIILVPKIGCNSSHYSIKHNLYVIKL